MSKEDTQDAEGIYAHNIYIEPYITVVIIILIIIPAVESELSFNGRRVQAGKRVTNSDFALCR